MRGKRSRQTSPLAIRYICLERDKRKSLTDSDIRRKKALETSAFFLWSGIGLNRRSRAGAFLSIAAVWRDPRYRALVLRLKR